MKNLGLGKDWFVEHLTSSWEDLDALVEFLESAIKERAYLIWCDCPVLTDVAEEVECEQSLRCVHISKAGYLLGCLRIFCRGD